MSIFSQGLLKDTQDLVYYYNRYPRFKQTFLSLLDNNRAVFRTRPLRLYLKVATSLTPTWFQSLYHKNLREVQQSLGQDPRRDFFTKLYHNAQEYAKFLQKTRDNSPIFSPQADADLERIDQIPSKSDKLIEFLNHLSQPETKFSGDGGGLLKKAGQIARPTAQNLSSSGQILAKNLMVRYLTPTRAASAVGAAIGGLVGLSTGGTGAVAMGALAGGLSPLAIRAGLGNLLPSAGGRLPLNLIQLTPIGRAVTWTRYLVPVGIGVVLLIYFILMPGGGMNLLNTTSILNTQIAEGSPLEGPLEAGGGGNVNLCQFTRDGVDKISLKSTILAGWFNDISIKTSVPAAVLASVARHEVPTNFSQATDESPAIKKNFNNTRNESGDLGFMQINLTHPQNIAANTVAGQKAAQKLGKNFINLGYCRTNPDVLDNTNLDFCNIRDSIAIAAEVLNIKLSAVRPGGGSWSNLDDLEKASCYYHNIDCLYPPATKKYDYGKEVRADYLACQQLPSAPSGPVPTLSPGSDYITAIKQQFNVDFQDPFFKTRPNEMRWSYEILSRAKTTAPSFFNLVGPATVKISSQTSERQGSTIFMRNSNGAALVGNEERLYKYFLIHELGHIIRGDGQKYDTGLRAIISREGHVSRYGDNPCYGTASFDEDFSETVTGFINNDIPPQDLGCGIRPQDTSNTVYSNRYLLHFNFIKSILNP